MAYQRLSDGFGDGRDQQIGVLLLHGWRSRRPVGHWHNWLAASLAERGHQVAYPQLPDPDEPQLDAWMDAASEALGSLTASSRIVVCHSLGCLAWLHLAERHRGEALVARLALVAPPGPRMVSSTPEISGFAFDAHGSSALGARAARLVYSDDDPYCPEVADEVYGKLPDLDRDLLPGQAHLDMDAGYGSWPSLLDWCVDGRTRISSRFEELAASVA